MPPGNSHTHQYLTALFGRPGLIADGLGINIRTLMHGESGSGHNVFHMTIDGVLNDPELQRRNLTSSIYVGMALRDLNHERPGTKDASRIITSLWADLDAKDFLQVADPKAVTIEERTAGKRLILEALKKMLPASILVDTGGGYQPAWLFREPVRIGVDASVEDLEAMLRGVCQQIGLAASRPNMDSIMRLPGFVNRKYPDLPVARLVGIKPERVYTLADFKPYFEAARQAAGERQSAPTTEPNPDAGRDFPALVAWLRGKGLILKQRREGYYITCWWKAEHTSDSGPSETELFLPSESNAWAGGFKCQHLHCLERRIGDLYALMKAEQREAAAGQTDPTAPVIENELIASWQVLDVAEFATWNFPPIEFIIEDLLPLRGLAWVGGRAKRGKSLFMLYLCLAIASGRTRAADFFDIKHRPKILYIAREDSGGRVKERIGDIVRHWKAPIRAGGMKVIVRPKGFNLGAPKHMAWVLDQCQTHGYTMVVFDTWTALSPGHDPMGALAQTTLAQAVAHFTETFDGCAVVVDHSRKNRPDGTTLSSADILGPSQKWQAAETILMLADTKETAKIEVFIEGKDLDQSRFYILMSPRGSDIPDLEKFTYAGSVETAAEASRATGNKNCQKVLAVVLEATMGITHAQIMEKTSFSKATVTRHLGTLLEAKQVMSDPLGHGYIPYQAGQETGGEAA
jgi:hypothetical protein